MTSPAHDPWQDRLSDYLDSELREEEREALETHLAGCAVCRGARMRPPLRARPA